MKLPPMTDRAKAVLAHMRENAPKRGRAAMECIDLMLGLLSGPARGMTLGAFLYCDFPDDSRFLKELLNQSGPEIITMGTALPWTPRCREVITKARTFAKQTGCLYVGAEHLLMGCLSVESVVTELLRQSGFNVAAAPARLQELFRVEPPRAELDEFTQLVDESFGPKVAAPDQLKAAAREFALQIGQSCRPSRERYVAILRLQEVVMWAGTCAMQQEGTP